MAHALTTTNGQVEFAYRVADGMPWHGLGQPMQGDETIEQWRVSAGMDWRIRRSKVRYATAHGQGMDDFLELPDQHVLFRSDTHAALGVVSDRYKVVQPGEVLEFFRDIVRSGGLELSAAGTILGGRRFWATAKIGEASPTSVKDTIGGFLLISTSADGSLSTEVRRTTIRTVCSNTLAMALKGAPASVKITHRSEFDPSQVKDFMGLNESAWDAFRHQVTRLANVAVSEELAEEMTVRLLGGVDTKTRTSAGFLKIMDLFNGAGKGAQLDGVAGTAWGWLNSVTEFQDWWTRARSTENRFVSSQWGQGAQVKQEALDMALALTN
jgi:phage/plasmid-like protein (TIGR03299 family)